MFSTIHKQIVKNGTFPEQVRAATHQELKRQPIAM